MVNLQVFLLGVGECLIDDIEVLNAASRNLLATSGAFESGFSGWTPQGSHDMSTIENTGFNSARSLHLRAASRGDNGANQMRSPDLSPGPGCGSWRPCAPKRAGYAVSRSAPATARRHSGSVGPAQPAVSSRHARCAQ